MRENMLDRNYEMDREALEKLMADETVCWAEVTRLARDADGQGY